MKCLLLAAVLGCLSASFFDSGIGRAEETAPATFEPAKTYAIIAGVLSWKGNGLSGFSAEDRQDQRLYDTLAARGVPRDQMTLLLDDAATLAAMRAALEKATAEAPAGSTLIFYYAGHGARHDGATYFMNYDVEPGSNDTSFAVSEISRILGGGFRGERILLFADCCHSGGLEQAASALAAKGYKAASLAAADAATVSTANWTFTITLIEALTGHPLLDDNGDNAVTLAEAANEVALSMKHYESQRSGYATCGLDAGFVLATAQAPIARPDPPVEAGYSPGDYVSARDGENWRAARVAGLADGRYAVEFQEYRHRSKVWREKEELAPAKLKRYEVGQDVQVLSSGRWWPAKVVDRQDDFHQVNFPGWSADWDEWVLSTRIAAADAKVEAAIAATPAGLSEPPLALDDEAAGKKGRVDGKYQNLLKKIKVAGDYRLYGAFNDYGYFPATSYFEHRDLPAGYWVYVYPHWYLWGDSK